LRIVLNITSGVSRGSVLGPLLFIIFVNDLPDVVSSTMSTFVDDTKLYYIVKSLQDQLALQRDLNNVMGWGKESKMSSNNLKLGHHISAIVHKANSKTGIVIDHLTF